jgi:hypothetical protein
MDSHGIEQLAVELAAFTQTLEQRAAAAGQRLEQASENLRCTAGDVAASAQRMTGSAVAEFKHTASDVLADGMRPALEQADAELRERLQEIAGATRQLEQRVRTLNALHTANAWKAFVASAVASLAVIVMAVYTGIHAHQEVQRSQWVGAINAAVADGKLTACEEGGICARVGRKWVRLDR